MIDQASEDQGTGRQAPDDGPDLVERFVGMLFGKAALESREPFGMRRLSAEDAPEMYPATLDEWADPVEGDSPQVALIRPLLAGTRVRTLPLRCPSPLQPTAHSAAPVGGAEPDHLSHVLYSYEAQDNVIPCELLHRELVPLIIWYWAALPGSATLPLVWRRLPR